MQHSGRLQSYIVNWDLRESMTEADIEIILERAKELHPEARPRIISESGPQFIAKDFKEFISGLGHGPRQNFALLSSIERKNRTLAAELCALAGAYLKGEA